MQYEKGIKLGHSFFEMTMEVENFQIPLFLLNWRDFQLLWLILSVFKLLKMWREEWFLPSSKKIELLILNIQFLFLPHHKTRGQLFSNLAIIFIVQEKTTEIEIFFPTELKRLPIVVLTDFISAGVAKDVKKRMEYFVQPFCHHPRRFELLIFSESNSYSFHTTRLKVKFSPTMGKWCIIEEKINLEL